MASLFGKLKRAVAATDEEKAAGTAQKAEDRGQTEAGGRPGPAPRRPAEATRQSGDPLHVPDAHGGAGVPRGLGLLSERVDEEQESSQEIAGSVPEAEARASKASKVATYDLGSQGVAGRPSTAWMWWSSRRGSCATRPTTRRRSRRGRGWSYASCRCSLLRLLR